MPGASSGGAGRAVGGAEFSAGIGVEWLGGGEGGRVRDAVGREGVRGGGGGEGSGGKRRRGGGFGRGRVYEYGGGGGDVEEFGGVWVGLGEGEGEMAGVGGGCPRAGHSGRGREVGGGCGE